MSRRQPRSLWYLGLVGLAAVILVSLMVLLHPEGNPLDWTIRLTASLGYVGVFLAIISSAYLRQLAHFFGRPFIHVHHALSITSLALITLHPIGVAINAGDLAVFLPRFDSLHAFLVFGGRPAWYLLAIAALAAWLRHSVGHRWRIIHYLNYLAFWLATAHAILIGTNFQQYAAARVVSILMSLAVVAVFVQKLVWASQRKKRRTKAAL